MKIIMRVKFESFATIRRKWRSARSIYFQSICEFSFSYAYFSAVTGELQ